MAYNFRNDMQLALTQLQEQNRRQQAENEELIAQHARELTATTDGHEAQRVELINTQRKLAEAMQRIERGIEAYGRDWDVALPDRQSWIDFLAENNYSMESMPQAYRMHCIENNIHNGKRKGKHALSYVDREDAGHEDLPLVDPEENFDMAKSFPFMRLINEFPEIARKIAVMTMQKGKIIHFIARLDVTEPYPPMEGSLCRVTQVPMRFWWGRKKDVHINSATTVRDTLAPLYVCRDFAEIFGTAFWALNKFSFATFGELNIFKKNTRTAYIQRIQTLEIWWQGSSSARPLGWEPRWGRYDRRTWPLSILTAMHRLKSLEIYVDESSKKAKRRKNEPTAARTILVDGQRVDYKDDVQMPLLEATRGQDNNRQYRDLRKLHGLDYVYQLRNLNRVRVYDLNEDEKRTSVRDISFAKDMRAQVTQRKSRKRAYMSRFENLKPLFRRRQYQPGVDGAPDIPAEPPYVKSPQVEWIARSFFDIHLPWDPASVHAGPAAGGDDGDNGGGGDEDDDDGSNGGNDHQDGGDGSESESGSDSDDPDSLFVSQEQSNSVVAQARGFQGRRAMSSDSDGNLSNGFSANEGNSSQSLGGPRRMAGQFRSVFDVDSSDDEMDDEIDDDVIVDEARSAPRPQTIWGQHIDLTDVPIKEEGDKDEVMGVATRLDPEPTQQPPNSVEEVGAANDGSAAAPPLGHTAVHEQELAPKPDADAGLDDIYGATPPPHNRAHGPNTASITASPFVVPSASEMPEEVPLQPLNAVVPEEAMADLNIGPIAPQEQASDPAQASATAPSGPETIVIDDAGDDDDDDLVFVSSNFIGFSGEKDPINLDDDSDADSSYNKTAASLLAEERRVKEEEAEAGPVSPASGTMREAANLRRDLQPQSRDATLSSSAETPSSSRLAAEDAVFNDMNFGSQTPEPAGMNTPRASNEDVFLNDLNFGTPNSERGMVTPLASNSRRKYSRSSDGSRSIRSTSSKRSRDEDGSTPTPVDIDQRASKSRRSSHSSTASGSSVTRGIDESGLGGQHDGAGNSPPPKRRRRSDDDDKEKMYTARDSWLKSFSN